MLVARSCRGVGRWACCVALGAIVVAPIVTGCDEPKKPDQKPTVEAPPPSATATVSADKPPTMPHVSLSTTSVSIGIDSMPLTTPMFDVSFGNMLKRYPVSQPDVVVFNIDRMVKVPLVTKIFYALTDAGAKRFEVHTKPRGTFPDQLVIDTENSVGADVRGCTYVSMVLNDLGAVFWRKQGGRAKRYTKGMAGPDFSAMHVVMHKEAATCDSSVFLFSGGDSLDWGHAFDTAGSVKAADPAYEHINKLVLLRREPVPGKPVKLGTTK